MEVSKALNPIAVLQGLAIEVIKLKCPIAVFWLELEKPPARAHCPRETLQQDPAQDWFGVYPNTLPRVVGVAEDPPREVDHRRALAPVLVRTWPTPPQEPLQSTMPAPGRIAFVEQPVSQLQPKSNPIAN
jgi:hypothetical protein